MDKAFDLHVHLPVNSRNLLQRQFPGSHHTLRAQFLQEACSIHSSYGHLRTCVDRQFRETLSDQRKRPHILNDNRIDSPHIIRLQKRI